MLLLLTLLWGALQDLGAHSRAHRSTELHHMALVSRTTNLLASLHTNPTRNLLFSRPPSSQHDVQPHTLRARLATARRLLHQANTACLLCIIHPYIIRTSEERPVVVVIEATLSTQRLQHQ